MARGEVRAVTRVITCRADGKICALPLAHVLETMRPLPVRYITLRLASGDERRVAALAVDAVLGIADLEESALGELPELLKAAQGDLIRALGSLDSELLLVLEHSRVVPPEVWQQLGTAEAQS